MEQRISEADNRALPQATLDAGGEEWVVLREAIERSLSRMAVGETLEVVCQTEACRRDVPLWCYLLGHHLERMVTDGTNACFLIRKQ